MDARRLAELAVRTLTSYLEIYHGYGETVADSGMPAYDSRSTVAGQFEAAVNKDHGTPPVGFGRPGQGGNDDAGR